MYKSIYKITNLVNNKIYIGQSCHPKRRFQEHLWGHSGAIYLHSAIIKYGENNFSFELLEKDVEDYNEREKYWINFYQSNNPKFGYNLTNGGEDPPRIIGEDNNKSKYSNNTVFRMQQDILNTSLTFQEIAQKYQCPESYLHDLSTGRVRYNKTLSYPLRKTAIQNNDKDIFNDLLLSTLSIKDIAIKYDTTIYTIYSINEGKRYKQINQAYPIRINGTKISSQLLKNIKDDLFIKNMSKSDVAYKYNISRTTLYNILKK